MTDNVERWPETVLVLRCQTGDEAALEELVGRYGSRLRYHLRKLLGEMSFDGGQQEAKDRAALPGAQFSTIH